MGTWCYVGTGRREQGEVGRVEWMQRASMSNSPQSWLLLPSSNPSRRHQIESVRTTTPRMHHSYSACTLGVVVPKRSPAFSSPEPC